MEIVDVYVAVFELVLSPPICDFDVLLTSLLEFRCLVAQGMSHRLCLGPLFED